MNWLVGSAVAAGLAGGTTLTWVTGRPSPARPSWLSPLRVLVLGLVVLDGIGASLLALSGEATGGPLLVAGAMLAVGSASWVARSWLDRHPDTALAIVSGPPRWTMLAGLFGLGLVMYAWLALDYGIPLLSSDAQASRAGFAGIRLDLFRWLAPPAAVALAAIALRTRRRHDIALAASAGATVVALEVLAASRALPFELGLAVVIIAVWAGVRATTRRWILVGAVAAAVFLGVLFARIGPGGGFTSPAAALGFAVDRTVGRVLLIQPRTIEVVTMTYPQQEPYLLGTTYTRWIGRLTPGPTERSLGAELFDRLFPDQAGSGFAAPGILGEGYANFGPVFALGLMGLLGVLGAALARIVPASPDPWVETMTALLTVALLRTYATSLNGFLLTAAAAVGWWVVVAAPVGTWASFLVARARRPSGPDPGEPAATDGLDAEQVAGAPEPPPGAGSESP